MSFQGLGCNPNKAFFECVYTHSLQCKDEGNAVYAFMDRKRAEGKHYYVYMTAAANKFLRIYYGTVTAYLETL